MLSAQKIKEIADAHSILNRKECNVAVGFSKVNTTFMYEEQISENGECYFAVIEPKFFDCFEIKNNSYKTNSSLILIEIVRHDINTSEWVLNVAGAFIILDKVFSCNTSDEAKKIAKTIIIDYLNNYSSKLQQSVENFEKLLFKIN